jgi:hypothetical protein
LIKESRSIRTEIEKYQEKYENLSLNSLQKLEYDTKLKAEKDFDEFVRNNP